MRVSYNKLWKMLIDRGMKKSQLREAVGASKSTFAKLGKNENVTLPVLLDICEYLQCDFGDIMEALPTDNTFQIEVSFDERFMYGRILSQNPVNTEYTVFNSAVSYIKQDGRLFQIAHVCRAEKDKKSDIQVSKELYINQCEIGYELPDNTKYEERGV